MDEKTNNGQTTTQHKEKSQAEIDAITKRISIHYDIDGNPRPSIDETNEKIIRYFRTAEGRALDNARHISPNVADVKTHPLPAFQDIIVEPISKRMLKDVVNEIDDYLNDELQYFAYDMMHGLEDFIVLYQGLFLVALQQLVEKKLAVCDTLGKEKEKQKLIDAYATLPSFPSPEEFEKYKKRICTGDDPDPTEEMVIAWRSHTPTPFPAPEKFIESFKHALMLDAEVTEEINNPKITTAPADEMQEVLDKQDDMSTAISNIENIVNTTQGGLHALTKKVVAQEERIIKSIKENGKKIDGVGVRVDHLKGEVKEVNKSNANIQLTTSEILAVVADSQSGKSANGNGQYIPDPRTYQVTTELLSEILMSKNCKRTPRTIQLWEQYLKTNGKNGTKPPDDYNLYTRLSPETARAWADRFAAQELPKLRTKVAFDELRHQRPK